MPLSSKASAKPATKKTVHSTLGAPSQHNQPSRKGKKAWRKNVDLQEVEEGIEELRKEERATGTFLHKQADDQLFVVDVKGDDKIRSVLPKFKSSELTSARILAQRSAVPALVSRATATSTKKRKAPLSKEDKERLLRIGKRTRRGPFNSVVDPAAFGQGSASLELSEAVKQSGGYDPWAAQDAENGVQPKAPRHRHPRDGIEVPAILEPHQGTAYNPPADAHQALLLKAYAVEEKRAEEAARLAEEKARFERARKTVQEDIEGVPAGMKIDDLPQDEEEEVTGEEMALPKKMPQRKTKSQRKKAERLLAEKRVLIERARKKSELALIHNTRQLRRTANKTLLAQNQAHALRRAALQEKLRHGLGGHKIGKHRVPVEEVDVQLGEDLSESLRALKPEGNLFRDRFTSLQQRALIEPRVPVLPKKRRHRIIEYEKHAWKRFE
ncbi:ribosome biogenesis protein Nop53/GLTSCR2 [Mycena pura]|uniref:Ribosome biogenesis protein NOP53 n=1 Tax=Mycena pura TaxID=153505 RepID=A0AAD6YVY5_9AGAR|nr:ribosome biogenesis protein Nop53/GLTSCR2 [Mycena pura]